MTLIWCPYISCIHRSKGVCSLEVVRLFFDGFPCYSFTGVKVVLDGLDCINYEAKGGGD